MRRLELSIQSVRIGKKKEITIIGPPTTANVVRRSHMRAYAMVS
jgi:hypothetical protein